MTDEKDRPDDEIEFIPGAGPADQEKPKEPPSGPASGKKERAEKNAGHETGRIARDKIKKKEEEIRHLKKEVQETKDRLLRKLADIENLRKRFDKEKSDYYQYAFSGLLLELVGIVDNFERALQSAAANGDGKTFREGVDLIFRMFQNLLAKNGVRPIVLKDRAFDPNFHHAMTVAESDDVNEPEVEEELQKGYMHHDRLLRPTLVKVIVPKKG